MFLKENYPWVYLIPGQEYHWSRKLWFYCTTPGHGSYSALWRSVHTKSGTSKGCQCKKCDIDKARKLTIERTAKITNEFVGVTTLDGHTILEHIGYQQTPSHKLKGERGTAVYRYRCGVCGNEQATALGSNLKKQGNTTNCGCIIKGRDSIAGFHKSDDWSNSNCYVYIADVDGQYIKPGITNDLQERVRKSKGEYKDYLFVSPKLSRCEAWAIEQNLLKFTEDSMPSLDELPDKYFDFGGKTELRFKNIYSLNKLRWKFDELLRQLESVGWEQLAMNAS